jgi:hypothetical protein
MLEWDGINIYFFILSLKLGKLSVHISSFIYVLKKVGVSLTH